MANKCYDANNTPLKSGDAVMCMANGRENEGTIIECKEDNTVVMDGETGTITVNASDVYLLP